MQATTRRIRSTCSASTSRILCACIRKPPLWLLKQLVALQCSYKASATGANASLRLLSVAARRSQSNLTALQAAQLWPQVTKVCITTLAFGLMFIVKAAWPGVLVELADYWACKLGLPSNSCALCMPSSFSRQPCPLLVYISP